MAKASYRVGIYSGSFDPVHIGHITFALQATQAANLDKVYLLPERNPRDKQLQEHFGHRVAMIKHAVKPHKKLRVLELDDKQFSVSKTLPKLQSRLPDQTLVFLFGSEKLQSIPSWPNSKRLFSESELVIGARKKDKMASIKQATKNWPTTVTVISSFAPSVTSTKIRLALNKNNQPNGLLKSVAKYIRKNWLYISLSQR